MPAEPDKLRELSPPSAAPPSRAEGVTTPAQRNRGTLCAITLPGHPAQGFTLVEMLTVVLVLAVVMTVAMPGTNVVESERVAVAAHEFETAFRFARSESMRTGVIHGVEVGNSDESLSVFRLDTTVDPAQAVHDVYDPVSRRIYYLSLDDHAHARGVDLSRDVDWLGGCSDHYLIGFRADGTPTCTDPLTALLESAVITLDGDDFSRTVTVDGFTGRVTTQ